MRSVSRDGLWPAPKYGGLDRRRRQGPKDGGETVDGFDQRLYRMLEMRGNGQNPEKREPQQPVLMREYKRKGTLRAVYISL